MRNVFRLVGMVVLSTGLACGGSNGVADRASGDPADGTSTTSGSTTSQPPTSQPPASTPGIEHVTIEGRTFDLELAADPVYRNRGLMFREHIAPDGGMLFVFTKAVLQNFWMGWCRTDIDIIYLDDRGRVTATHQMKAEPPQKPEETEADYRARMPDYSSRIPAQFVIELAGGTLDELSVGIGDTIAIDVERLQGLAR